APRAASPACVSATASACGRPPGRVHPRPTTIPSRTRIAPTAGLGRLSGRARSPRQAAVASQRASSRSLTRGLGGFRRRRCGRFGIVAVLPLKFVDVEAHRPTECAGALPPLLPARLFLCLERFLALLVLDVRGDDLLVGAVGTEGRDPGDLGR